MSGFRWTPQNLAAFEQRRKEWEAKGQVVVRERRIHDEQEPGRTQQGKPMKAPHRPRKPKPPKPPTLAGLAIRKIGENKFFALRTIVGGEKFDSRHEYEEYLKLKFREIGGEIEGLRRQVKFSLFDAGGTCRGEHIGTYRADFVYRERGALRVADAKSNYTKRLRDWPRTKALMRACHGIEVIEL